MTDLAVAAVGHDTCRTHLSKLRSLLVLSQLMVESSSERQILQLAVGAVRSLVGGHGSGVLLDGAWAAGDPAVADATAPVRVDSSGPVVLRDDALGWAYPLQCLRGHLGFLVVATPEPPSSEEQFLLRALAQQTGAAVGNRRLHEQEERAAEELLTANAAQQQTLEALQRSVAIHERLTQVAVSGEGTDGIARAVHDLTGHSVAVEDRYGNLRAWGGPNRPDPYPKDPAARREQLLRRALREGKPIRDGGRLLAVTRPQHDVIGVLVLIDPGRRVDDEQLMALEHGLTVLAMELARVRSLAETELRLRRDLVEEVLAGAGEESALRRAATLGYDLERPHRVVVVEGRGRDRDDDAFLHAVRRAARDDEVGSLLISRGSQVVVLAEREADWEHFRGSVLRELGGGRCRLGIGCRYDLVAKLPDSLREAERALRVQGAATTGDRATVFDDLGVYQLLAEVEDTHAVESFVHRWLGALLSYDRDRHMDLVGTLTVYLEHGGSYDATSEALFIHRSTLKYRLARIREITGHKLSDPDTRFNLQLATRSWVTLQALRG